jgi:peptidoglycan/LPS O-acetylase OafA/YrhL
MFVVVGHGSFILPPDIMALHRFFILDGVSIFFVLSGFLIGGILIKNLNQMQSKRHFLFNFWLRRWFRTLPNYFLILSILIALNYLFNEKPGFWEARKFFFFSQNLFYRHPDFFPEAWSLSVEEWFYLITPLILLVLINKLKLSPRQALLATAIAIITFSSLVRVGIYLNTSINSTIEWDLYIRKQVWTRLDSLMFGILGAYLNYYYHKSWLKFRKTLLILGITTFLSIRYLYAVGWIGYTGIYNNIFSLTVTSLATLALLPFLSKLKSGRGPLYRSISVISITSYSMYLIHVSLVQFNIVNRIPWNLVSTDQNLIYALKYALYWILTIGLSILNYKFFEVPTTKLRDHPRVKGLFRKVRPRTLPS